MLTPISTLILGQSPELAHTIHLKLKIYVTREKESMLSARALINEMTQTKRFLQGPTSTINIMPANEGLMWNVTIIGISFTIFLISILFLTRIFINEGDKPPSWVYDLLVICSFVINTTSVTIATVVSRWRRSADNSIRFSRKNHISTVEASSNTSMAQGLQQDFEINYGRRPNLIELLLEETIETEENKVGVFVCGPDSMQESVAYFCRKYSRSTWLRVDGSKKCSFVYHSINFSL